MSHLTVVLPPTGQKPRALVCLDQTGAQVQHNGQALRFPRFSVSGGYANEDNSYPVVKIPLSLALTEMQIRSLIVFSPGAASAGPGTLLPLRYSPSP